MLVYVFMLSLVVICVAFSRLVKLNSGSFACLTMGFLTMVLVAGVRDQSVGTDSGTYVRVFESTVSFADNMEAANKTGEYGYWLLSWFVRLFSDHYVFLFSTIAIIVVGCYHRTIYRYSFNPVISFYAFISLGFYTFFFNGARQGIACAICALSIGPLIKGEFKKYLIVVLTATLFHKTAIIMLPLYFLLRMKSSVHTTLLFFVLGLLSALSLSFIVESISQFDSRFQGYAIAGDGGGVVMSTFNILFWLFFYLFRKWVALPRIKYYDIFLNMLFFSAVISLISLLFRINPSGVLRLTMYFNIGAIFLLPICYESFANRGSKTVFISISGFFLFVYFFMTTSSFSHLVPYKLNSMLL